MKNCKNCGREMVNPADFGKGDTNSDYCNFCLKEDNNLRTFKEYRNLMVIHVLTSEGKKLTEQLGMKPAETQEDAEKLADWIMDEMVKNSPAMKALKDQG